MYSKVPQIAAISLSLAALTGASGVSAQESITELEEIIVTGSRASLTNSLNGKRDADSIMDGISAEELGVFPDANVADSLSHITGVSITRASGGEGQLVNIRGLGPQFSIVTVNERILATDQNGREFAFDVLPAEIISEAWVHKSVSASALEGSIGGAINLKTAKPFDNPEKVLNFSMEAQHGYKVDDQGYKITGVASNTFGDDRYGFLFSVLHADTPTRTDSLSDLNYGENWSWDHDNSDGGSVNWQDASNQLRIPSVVAYRARLEDKKRTALSGVFQMRPTDTLDIVIDALYTRLDAPAVGYTESYYMVANANTWREPTWGGVETELNPQGTTLTGVTMENLIPELVTFTEHRVVDTYQGGINLSYLFSDNFAITADTYFSQSVRDAGGKDRFVVAKAPGAVPNEATFSLARGELPSVEFEFGEETGITDVSELTENSDFGPHYSEYNGVDIKDTVVGASIVGEYTFNDSIVDSLEFGLVYNERNKSRDKYDNSGNRELYSEAPFTFADTGVDVIDGFGLEDFLSGIGGNFPREFVGFDIEAYQDALEAADGTVINPHTGEVYPEGYSDLDDLALNYNESFEVSEETVSAFVQANLHGDMFGMPWSGNVGVRYTTTDTSSDGWEREIVSVDQTAPGAWSWIVNYGGVEAVEVSHKNSYEEFLPSANFRLDINDQLAMRLSYADVMSRASINQLSTQQDHDSLTWGGWYINKTGNPNLEPATASQADISLEWYFTEGSMLTGAIFEKEIIGSMQEWQQVYVTPEERENLPTLSVENPQPWVSPEPGYVDWAIDIFEPRNLDKANVLGYEFGLQHWFENGFGVTANYTYIDTESYLTGDYYEGVLAGVADTSYSLYLYYSTEKVDLQIGASHTEEYVTSHWSPLNPPDIEATEDINENTVYKSTADPMTWMSASASYQATDQLQVYLELDNILNENWKAYVGEGIINQYEEWGRKVNVGLRYRF